jgi:hypothetical protein
LGVAAAGAALAAAGFGACEYTSALAKTRAIAVSRPPTGYNHRICSVHFMIDSPDWMLHEPCPAGLASCPNMVRMNAGVALIDVKEVALAGGTALQRADHAARKASAVVRARRRCR